MKRIDAPVEELRLVFQGGRTRGYGWRRTQLSGLKRFLEEHEERILSAVADDFGKPRMETWLTEIYYLRTDIAFMLRHLRRWMRPVRVRTPMLYHPARSFFTCEPHGVVLVMSAWNYPLQLALAPLAAAIAAGNCVVLKPSEQAPATARVIADVLPQYVDHEAVRVVQGDAGTSRELLAERFDHIFFTGSERIGREVAAAAARHLTPVTLELGGKSPCIVDRRTDIGVAARRIAWAKFINAGQTCISPDYVLVDEAVESELLDALCSAVQRMYGSGEPYARLISRRHTERLQRLMAGTRIVCGGRCELEECFIEPTVLTGVTGESAVMQEEIFGPLLPVLSYRTLDDAVHEAGSHGTPLALYIFSSSRSVQRSLMERIPSGGVGVNDLLFQAAVPGLPFGGRRESGMGRYHGKAGFETFSVTRSVHIKALYPENQLRYPPLSPSRFRWLQRLLKLFS
ncbi:aldehyde dehydrogenase family protein [Prosthecochloris sp. N3]|uniref:Aldehyde dehydrogenase n=1 Tax=Prosthecochloris ethylica TaxID=2743976 RepID=A0ABR9XP87_9CHLB|nr:aldehyde dehydrogenase family protein [Prosthecochloris ethylica]MBF0585738.1 aldehyde dehydrogenase family protein [Prosthecochloris ethylica]MBF0635648.1 aldehyde dehydrogenase family protein [Prosthecochloris ethylica]NUK46947.1 aldehyde dehydrogenase family protein [Prosthecochloris ethylica]